MAIHQEKRIDAPSPEVIETDYGAQTVKAATESPIVEQQVADLDPKEEVNDEAPVEEKVVVKKPVVPKKAKGRPKKTRK